MLEAERATLASVVESHGVEVHELTRQLSQERAAVVAHAKAAAAELSVVQDPLFAQAATLLQQRFHTRAMYIRAKKQEIIVSRSMQAYRDKRIVKMEATVANLQRKDT